MANEKISQLPLAAALAGAELIELVQSGANVQSTVSKIFTACPNVYWVGAGMPYATVAAAITAINAGSAPTASDPVVIFVMPGLYVSSAPITVPQYVSICAITGYAPLGGVAFRNDSTDVFECSGYNTFTNLTFLQGQTASTWAVNVGNTTDVSLYGCAFYGASVGTQQGFVSANGNSWVRLTIQNCIANSFATSGPIVQLINTTTSVRFCDTWIRNCFLDSYHLTSAGYAVYASGVQDVRIEDGCTFRGSSPSFTGVYLAKGSVTSGTPQIEIRHLYTGGNSVGCYNEAGTNLNILNSDVAGTGGAGTQTVHNSYTGASYNSLPI